MPLVLFNVYVDDLIETLIEGRDGLNVCGTKMNSLLYADNTVLLAPARYNANDKMCAKMSDSGAKRAADWKTAERVKIE